MQKALTFASASADDVGRGFVDGDQRVRALQQRGAVRLERGPDLLIGRIGEVQRVADAGFERHRHPEPHELVDDLGREPHAPFSCSCFLERDDIHLASMMTHSSDREPPDIRPT
ncbi:MAG: hypothetical protein P8Y05_15360 [Deinococcales bacterium]